MRRWKAIATTKIWQIKGSIKNTLNYAANPEKTAFDSLKQSLLYAADDEKTEDENEKTYLVSGVNCNPDTAFEEMQEVQKRFNKSFGNVGYHAYQSFKTGEVSPEKAHQIGVELAKQMWGDGYQVLVATHLNTKTIHNHFVLSSVNMWTGKKYNCNEKEYYRLRNVSDELCRENYLTVIKNPGGKTPRKLYFAEKNGEPTKYNIYRKAIDDAIRISISDKQFFYVMRKMGYEIKGFYTYERRKYPTVRALGDKKAVRLFRLGEEYSPERIHNRILENPYYTQQQFLDFSRTSNPEYVEMVPIYTPQQTEKIRAYFKDCDFEKELKRDIDKAGVFAPLILLYATLFYLLGAITPEHQEKHYPISPELRQEIRKLDRYIEQMNLAGEMSFESFADVEDFISETDRRIEEAEEKRRKIYNKLRRCDETEKPELLAQRNELTNQLRLLRKQQKTAQSILADAPQLRDKIRAEKEMMRNWYFKEKKERTR